MSSSGTRRFEQMGRRGMRRDRDFDVGSRGTGPVEKRPRRKVRARDSAFGEACAGDFELVAAAYLARRKLRQLEQARAGVRSRAAE